MLIGLLALLGATTAAGITASARKQQELEVLRGTEAPPNAI